MEGEKRIATWSTPDRFAYAQADIADKDKLKAALDRGLANPNIPKNSLFGAVHCAAVNPPETVNGPHERQD